MTAMNEIQKSINDFQELHEELTARILYQTRSDEVISAYIASEILKHHAHNSASIFLTGAEQNSGRFWSNMSDAQKQIASQLLALFDGVNEPAISLSDGPDIIISRRYIFPKR